MTGHLDPERGNQKKGNPMTTDSTKDKMAGKLREVKGAATGNKSEEAKGKLQSGRGTLKAKLSLVGKNGTKAGH